MNRLLLDTHVFLWWQDDRERLAEPVRTAIVNAAKVFVSAASAWEAAIKVSIGKLELPESFSSALPKYGFAALPITMQHSEVAAKLPLHHRDPFDRMLIAQAQIEHLVLVTADEKIRCYPVSHLWCD